MIQPVGNRILIELEKEKTVGEKKTASGIIVMVDEKKQEAPRKGKITAIGNGEKVLKLGLKKGQTILFEKFSGEDFDIDGKKYKIVKEEEVMAIQT